MIAKQMYQVSVKWQEKAKLLSKQNAEELFIKAQAWYLDCSKETSPEWDQLAKAQKSLAGIPK